VADLREDLNYHLGNGTEPRYAVEMPPEFRPAPVDTQTVQGEVEGAPPLDDTNSFEFLGERFKMAPSVGLMPLLRFANASKKGLDSDDFEGMAAMYAMIRGVVHRPPLLEPDRIEEEVDASGTKVWVPNPLAGQPQRDPATGKRVYDETEWDRFMEHAEDEAAEGDDLMELVGKVMGILAARPRQRRAVSSGTSPATSPSSKGSSSSPATPARPDLDMSQLTAASALGR
jgi:hypothetical protein